MKCSTMNPKFTNTLKHFIELLYWTSLILDNGCGTNSNAFTMISKVWLPMCQFLWNSQSHRNCCGHVLYWIVSKLDENCRKYRQKFIWVIK